MPAVGAGATAGIGARRMGLVGKRMATLATRGVKVAASDMVAAEAYAGNPRLRVTVDVSSHNSGGWSAGESQMPPPPPRQRSTRAMAGDLGLLGPLSGVEARDRWVTPPSVGEGAALAQLRASADFRLQHASAVQPLRICARRSAGCGVSRKCFQGENSSFHTRRRRTSSLRRTMRKRFAYWVSLFAVTGLFAADTRAK